MRLPEEAGIGATPARRANLASVAKALGAGGLGDQLGGGQRAAALQLQQLGRLGFDQGGDLAFELAARRVRRRISAHQLAGDPHPGALLGAGELAGEPIQPDDAVQGAGRDLQLGPEVVQVPAQAATGLLSGP